MAPLRLLAEVSCGVSETVLGTVSGDVFGQSSFLGWVKRKRIRKELEKGRRSEMGKGTTASSGAGALSVWGRGVELAEALLMEARSEPPIERVMEVQL